jgi:hypothetical protein
LANKIGNPESTTPTAEFVVPKSIPKIISLIRPDLRAADGFRQRQERVIDDPASSSNHLEELFDALEKRTIALRWSFCRGIFAALAPL